MKYFNRQYFTDDQGESLEHRAKNGTANSTSDEKGTDNKKNNTSEYNRNYYVKNKEKWEDNESSTSDDKKETDTDEADFDVDAAAMDVIRGKYKNGEERKRILGDDYEIIQKRVNELMKQMGKDVKKSETKSEESGEKEESSSSDDKKIRTFDEAHSDYKKQKAAKHSDDLGSVLVSSLF